MLIEGVSGGDPAGGARLGVPRLRLATAGSGGAETDRRALRPVPRGARCTISGGNAGRRKRGPAPKNRRGGAPNGARPRSAGDARRLASAWRAASWHARRVPLHPGAVRRSAAPRSGRMKEMFNTRARMRRGNVQCRLQGGGLYDIVEITSTAKRTHVSENVARRRCSAADEFRLARHQLRAHPRRVGETNPSVRKVAAAPSPTAGRRASGIESRVNWLTDRRSRATYAAGGSRRSDGVGRRECIA